MLRVNCEAVLRMSHALCRDMESSGSGQLVLFGSLVGFQGNAMTANYSATKAYVQTLAEGLRQEMTQYGIHVLAIAPGPIVSGFSERANMTMTPAYSHHVAHPIGHGEYISTCGTKRLDQTTIDIVIMHGLSLHLTPEHCDKTSRPHANMKRLKSLQTTEKTDHPECE